MQPHKASAGIGKVYDLLSLFDRLNKIYFDSKLDTPVRWSAREAKKAKRHILLGHFQPRTRVITLSKRLDRAEVPLFFVEHVLFHEMLHAVFPSEKHKMHTETFKKYERMHPDYERARQWEKANLKILFSASQTSLPIAGRSAGLNNRAKTLALNLMTSLLEIKSKIRKRRNHHRGHNAQKTEHQGMLFHEPPRD